MYEKEFEFIENYLTESIYDLLMTVKLDINESFYTLGKIQFVDVRFNKEILERCNGLTSA